MFVCGCVWLYTIYIYIYIYICVCVCAFVGIIYMCVYMC